MNTAKDEIDKHRTERQRYSTSPTANTNLANTYKQRVHWEGTVKLDEEDDKSFCKNHSCSTNGSDLNSIITPKMEANLRFNIEPMRPSGSRRMSHREHSSYSEPIDVTQTNLRLDDHGELFAQKIQIRPKHQTNPTSRLIRTVSDLGTLRPLRKSLSNILSLEIESESDSHSVAQASDVEDKTATRKQYTVTIEKARSTLKRLIRLINPDEYSYSPNQLLVRYINWNFAATFTAVLFSFTFGFLIMCLVFALFIKIAGDANPECLVIAGEQYGHGNSPTFSDSFHLSWTTFTTVGYGAAYTATGVDHANQRECIFVTFLCTVESFTGLLYVGFCTAILFSKVGRVQSHAQVSFSNVICIQYGNSGMNTTNNRNEGETIRDIHDTFTHSQEDSPSSKIDCPVLKFQLINKLANVPGGDIIDAKINVVGRREMGISEETVAQYVKVRLQESTHPFFSRVWHCTHILNKHSRLLSLECRQAIIENDGFWPDNMLSPEKVRETLRFDKIVITLTGISDLTAANVQIAKKYEKRDVMIGYDFAPMVYKEEDARRDEENRLKVDMSLMHDIIEQEECNKSYIEKIPENTDDNICREDSLSFKLRRIESISYFQKSSVN